MLILFLVCFLQLLKTKQIKNSKQIESQGVNGLHKLTQLTVPKKISRKMVSNCIMYLTGQGDNRCLNTKVQFYQYT